MLASCNTEKGKKVAVCDDDIRFQTEIKQYLYEYFGKLEVSVTLFSSGSQLLNVCDKELDSFDLIFMDIEMPGLDGVETARRIRKLNQEVFLVFLTSHTELTTEGYEVNAFRFLLKPIQREKLWKTLQDWEQLSLTEDRLCLNDGEKERVLFWHEIYYIQSENVYIRVVTKNEQFLVRKKLHELEKQMPKQLFYRPHRCFLVNMKHVHSFNMKNIMMMDNMEIPISRARASEFQSQMMKFISR